jgi:hypothetical protein
MRLYVFQTFFSFWHIYTHQYNSIFSYYFPPPPIDNVGWMFSANTVVWYHGNNIVFGGEGGGGE